MANLRQLELNLYRPMQLPLPLRETDHPPHGRVANLGVPHTRPYEEAVAPMDARSDYRRTRRGFYFLYAIARLLMDSAFIG